MHRILLILPLAATLSGCGMEEIFNPGSSRVAYERQQAIIAPIVAVATPAAIAPADGMIVPASIDPPVIPEPEPAVYVPPPPAPDCVHDLYRIFRCVDGKVMPWGAQ